jgi:hypothetical protein
VPPEGGKATEESVALVINRKKKKKKRSPYKWKTDVQSITEDRDSEAGVSEDRLLSTLKTHRRPTPRRRRR